MFAICRNNVLIRHLYSNNYTPLSAKIKYALVFLFFFTTSRKHISLFRRYFLITAKDLYMSIEKFVTIYSAAILGDYSALTIRNAIKTNKLPAKKIGGKFFIQRPDFESWLASKGRKIQGDA